MSFELLPSITGWAIAFVVLAVAAVVVATGLVASTLMQTRQVRVARHESVRHYYGHLVLGH